MATNITTATLSAAAVTARDAEYNGTPFSDTVGDGTTTNPYLGCNRAGSNAPGIGINTGAIDPKLDDWTVLDQAEAARTPQQSMHIAGVNVAITPGTPPTSTAIDINAIQGADVNDQVGFAVADQIAVADAVYDTVGGMINKTGATTAVGDRIWGPIPVV